MSGGDTFKTGVVVMLIPEVLKVSPSLISPTEEWIENIAPTI